MAKIYFNVPSHDRRRKNYTQCGSRFTHTIGDTPVVFVLQDNGNVAHLATGGVVLSNNSIMARMVSHYTHNPYSTKLTAKKAIAQLLDEIDPKVFYDVTSRHPVINSNSQPV